MRSTHAVPPDRGSDDGLWLTLGAAGMAACVVDSRATILWSNASFGDLFATTPADAAGSTLPDVLRIEEHAALRIALTKVVHGTDALRRLDVVAAADDGSARDLTISISQTRLWDGQGRALLVAEDRTRLVQPLRNIIERRFEMARRATEGSLAGLPSRSTLEFLLASSLRRASERHIPFALLFCDIEGLGEIGYQHGHDAVDEMRWIIAARMNRVLRLHDTLAHLGGDEFVVIAEEVGNLDVARLVASRLVNSARQSLRVKDVAAQLELVVGIVLPTGNENAYELLTPGPRDAIVRSRDPVTA